MASLPTKQVFILFFFKQFSMQKWFGRGFFFKIKAAKLLDVNLFVFISLWSSSYISRHVSAWHSVFDHKLPLCSPTAVNLSLFHFGLSFFFTGPQVNNGCFCENNGICIRDSASWKCFCMDGFVGKRCQIPVQAKGIYFTF